MHVIPSGKYVCGFLVNCAKGFFIDSCWNT